MKYGGPFVNAPNSGSVSLDQRESEYVDAVTKARQGGLYFIEFAGGTARRERDVSYLMPTT